MSAEAVFVKGVEDLIARHRNRGTLAPAYVHLLINDLERFRRAFINANEPYRTFEEMSNGTKLSPTSEIAAPASTTTPTPMTA